MRTYTSTTRTITWNQKKSTFIEKIAFALLPITFSCIVYLISALSDVRHRITLLESKIQVAVSADNKLIINPVAELAREKLRQDFLEADVIAKIQQTNNIKDIEFLKWRIAELEKHK